MNQDLFVQMALTAWNQQNKRLITKFDGLSDEQLFAEIAPGKNRCFYLLGHMVAVHDMMLPLLDLGERQYPQLDEAFIKNPDKTITDVPAAQQLREYWTRINELLQAKFTTLSPADWFQKHTMISDEDFAREPHRNKLSVLISRTNHAAYHLGQLVLV